VRQLLEALNSATSSAQRAAILGALEAIPDHRTVEAVRALLSAPELEVRLAAARASRALLGLPQGTPLLDTTTVIALDRSQPDALRASVIEALATLPPRTVDRSGSAQGRPLARRAQPADASWRRRG
jgi:HEAT repeat protein